MNQLSKEQEAILKTIQKGRNPGFMDLDSPTEELDRIHSYLLLLYQAYLNGETHLEPEFKMALWRGICMHDPYQRRVERILFHSLKKPVAIVPGDWERGKEVLFPRQGKVPNKSLAQARKSELQKYRNELLRLLNAAL